MEPRISLGGTREFGIWGSQIGIRAPLFGIRNPGAGIWNPKATWIPLQRVRSSEK